MSINVPNVLQPSGRYSQIKFADLATLGQMLLLEPWLKRRTFPK